MTRVVAALSATVTATAVALALSGCADRDRTVGPAVTPLPSASPAATPLPSAGPACLTGTATLTEADNGRSVCVTVGTAVDVVLHGSPEARWSPVEVDGPALRVRASGKLSVPVGVTAASFSAAEPGTARLTSSRPACPSPPPGGVACLARVGFQVSVTVR